MAMDAFMKTWHEFISTKKLDLIDGMFAEDAVFHSPTILTPFKGKHAAKLVLSGAYHVLSSEESKFTYVREVINDKNAILEFTAEVDGIYINGVDMIELDENNKIKSFTVMLRPLKAVQKMKEKMDVMMGMLKK
jgi:hypothetical protein